MKRNKYRDYLWYTALAIFVLCILEGIMYYHETDNLFLKISLNIQNAIKAYKIDPDIKQKDAIAYLANSEGGMLAGVITYLYCISVIVAPFCTVGALAMLLRKPASYVRGLFQNKKKNRIIVIGEGKYQGNFVNALAKECKVSVIQSNVISDEKKLKYLNQGVKFIPKYDDMPIKDLMKAADILKYDNVLFCDDNPMENVKYLKTLVECCREQKGTAKGNSQYQQLFIYCNDNSMSELIRQYYDCLETKYFDLNIVDVNQMAVNKMLMEHPIYQVNCKDNYDVHIGIIGFGEFGQSTLIQALNMSVLSADSKICVDVFDKEISGIMGSFMKHFSVDALDGLSYASEEVFCGEKSAYYTLRFPVESSGNGESAAYRKFDIDGSVELRFWKADAQTLQFNKIFRKCNEEFPFTYLVIAMGDTRAMADTIIDLKQLLYKKGQSGIGIPVVIRTKARYDMVEIYQEANLFTIETDRDVFSYASLTNQEVTDNAKKFNHRYNLLYDVINEYKKKGMKLDDKFMLRVENMLLQDKKEFEASPEKLEEAWHKMRIFDRESSIAQSLHQMVKKWLINEEKVYSLAEDKEILEKIEHRRWNIFMITHGYKYEEGEKKNVDAKTHPCISNWENLKKEKPDTLEYDYTPYCMLMVDAE